MPNEVSSDKDADDVHCPYFIQVRAFRLTRAFPVKEYVRHVTRKALCCRSCQHGGHAEHEPCKLEIAYFRHCRIKNAVRQLLETFIFFSFF